MDEALIPNKDNAIDAVVVSKPNEKIYLIITHPKMRQWWWKIEADGCDIAIYWAVTSSTNGATYFADSNTVRVWRDEIDDGA